MERELSVGAIVFRKNKEIKYLILQYGLGHWGFVKGKLEKGESEKETVIREAEEETGIKDLEFLDNFREKESYFYRWEEKLISKDVIYYLTKTNTEKIKLSHEHKYFKWLNYEDILKILKFKNEKEIFRKADEFLRNEKTSVQRNLDKY